MQGRVWRRARKGSTCLFFFSRKIVLFSVTICLCLLRAFRIVSERILSREAYDTLKRFATISKISLYTCSSPWREKGERERNGPNPVVSLWVRPNNQSLKLTWRMEWKTMTHRDWKAGRSELHWMNVYHVSKNIVIFFLSSLLRYEMWFQLILKCILFVYYIPDINL